MNFCIFQLKFSYLNTLLIYVCSFFLPHPLGLNCMCNRQSVTKIEYDTNLRQPICTVLNCTNAVECNIQLFAPLLRSTEPCGLSHLIEVVSASPPSKSIQIQRIPAKNIDKNQTTNITCTSYEENTQHMPFECVDSKNYVRFKDYCIPNYLIKDFLNYKQFKATTTQPAATNANNLFENLEYLLFFCQTMKMIDYCEYVANLCVLTVYNLDKFSPCNIFYTMQTTVINTGSESYQTKLVPFLFYAKGRSTSDDLDKVIDYRYRYMKSGSNYHSEEYDMYAPIYSVSHQIVLMI